jgi:LemA protein
MKAILIVLGVLVVGGFLVGAKVAGVRNDLVTQRNGVDQAFAQVDVVLQRRADLIPNLVETVKGFAAQEKEVLQAVSDARAGLLSAKSPEEKLRANGQVDSAIGRLLVLTESYPQLRSNENFLRLQDELSSTENKIAVERRKYNETVTGYNTSIEVFPNNLVSGFFNFTRKELMNAPPAKREVPNVKFK